MLFLLELKVSLTILLLSVLELGRRGMVESINNVDIPTYYYNLASYDELRDRKKHPKLVPGNIPN